VRLRRRMLLPGHGPADPGGDRQPARTRPGVLPGGAVRDIPGQHARGPVRDRRPGTRAADRAADPGPGRLHDRAARLLGGRAGHPDVLQRASRERSVPAHGGRAAVGHRDRGPRRVRPVAGRVGVRDARVHAGVRSRVPRCRADPGRHPRAERARAGPVTAGVRDLRRPDRPSSLERAPGPGDDPVVPVRERAVHVVHRHVEQPEHRRRPAVRGRPRRDTEPEQRPGRTPLHHGGVHRPGRGRHPGHLGHAAELDGLRQAA